MTILVLTEKQKTKKKNTSESNLSLHEGASFTSVLITFGPCEISANTEKKQHTAFVFL